MYEKIFEVLLPHIVYLIIMSTFVYATLETAKMLIPKGELLIVGKQARILNFLLAYLYSWAFNFRFASNIFNTIRGENLAPHVDYLIVACIIAIGAKRIYKYIKDIEILEERKQNKI